MGFSKFLNDWRLKNGVTMIELSQSTGIDQGLISKYESGKRIPSDKHLLQFATGMNLSLHALRKEAIADKIANLLQYEEAPLDILRVAETRIAYLSSKKALQLQSLSDNIKEKLFEIDELQKQWNSNKPLNQVQLKKMTEYFDVNYTYDSNRIEGNTFTLQETHLVINEGITIGGKSMREHLEAINHYEAIAFIREMIQTDGDINKRNLLDIHRLVLKSIDNENAGVYRKIGVRISGSKHIPPDPLLVDQLMTEFFEFYVQNKNIMHPVILAAEMHERLVSIHPFVDGNGRTSRLVMNFILLQNGYTTAILKGDNSSRMSYYSALESVQTENNSTPFYRMILEKVEESLREHIELI
jgi:Fic family protein